MLRVECTRMVLFRPAHILSRVGIVSFSGYIMRAVLLCVLIFLFGGAAAQFTPSVQGQINATGLVGFSCDPTADLVTLVLQNGFVQNLNLTTTLHCDGDAPSQVITSVFGFELSQPFVMRGSTKPLVNRRCRIIVQGPNPFSDNEEEVTLPIFVYYDQTMTCGVVIEDDSDTENENYFDFISMFENGDWSHNAFCWFLVFQLPLFIIAVVGIAIWWISVRNKELNAVNELNQASNAALFGALARAAPTATNLMFAEAARNSARNSEMPDVQARRTGAGYASVPSNVPIVHSSGGMISVARPLGEETSTSTVRQRTPARTMQTPMETGAGGPSTVKVTPWK